MSHIRKDVGLLLIILLTADVFRVSCRTVGREKKLSSVCFYVVSEA
jgi:hypothetical protein